MKPRTYTPDIIINHPISQPDVFNHISDIGLTAHTQILGTGINGRDALHLLDPLDTTIGVNGAAGLHPIDIWMAFDREVLSARYMDDIDAETPRITGHNIYSAARADYSFAYMPAIMPSTQRLDSGVLHAGATVAGCALQLCYWAGCQSVTLCGIDMFGNRYADGTISPCHASRQNWGEQMHNMNRIIALVREGGMIVETISETALMV